MPIEQGFGNLLTADVEALVNTVNTRGVMGKGLALQFKKAFPDAFTSYDRACRAGEVRVGQMHVVERAVAPHLIINFPTKDHWRQPSKVSFITDGLADLVQVVGGLKVRSIAVPPLGCGLGGLDWQEVKPLIVAAFAELPEVRVVLFEPAGAPAPIDVIDRRIRPAMTEARAAILALMERYLATGYEYRLSLIEVQKLAYFLQAAGEPLRLSFKPHHFGPYADTLQKALRHLEGHYTLGLGDGRDAPETPLTLLPDAAEQARAFLETSPDVQQRLDRVARLIDGFETPFGMELLGTVHWVMQHGQRAEDLDEVVRGVHAWSSRKRAQMKPGHIEAAWRRLRTEAWA